MPIKPAQLCRLGKTRNKIAYTSYSQHARDQQNHALLRPAQKTHHRVPEEGGGNERLARGGTGKRTRKYRQLEG